MDLDRPEGFKRLDKENVLGSVLALPDQVEQAWYEALAGDVPQSCTLAKHVVVCGMGGSALGGRIVQDLYFSELRTPLEVITEYALPYYVGPGTLVIVSSYSGNTEETLSAAYEARQRNAQVFGITTGGELGEFLKKYNYPGYVFRPKHNPAGQPRLALGYSVAAIMALLAKCEFVSTSRDEVERAVEVARRVLDVLAPDEPADENLAKQVAQRLHGKVPILVASEHLVGAAHAFKNQLNETAKSFSALFDLPELNHHLMEGLKNPEEIKKRLVFVMINSALYSERVRARYPVTRTVVERNEVEVLGCEVATKTRLEQVLELMAFGSLVQYYLAMLYEQDPAVVPWVDYFKQELAKL